MKDKEFLKIDFEALNYRIKEIDTEKFIPNKNVMNLIMYNRIVQKVFQPVIPSGALEADNKFKQLYDTEKINAHCESTDSRSGADTEIKGRDLYKKDNLDILVDITINEVENDGSLSDRDKAETLNKIKEIKIIYYKEKNRVKRWNMLKPIICWSATTGADTYLKIAPLFIRLINK